ncbi:MAG: endolytic transglycosylase MltG [Eubacteriales bacterium]|nr:endolytic transglycosylase MltG [Eubacteriales bacterium]
MGHIKERIGLALAGGTFRILCYVCVVFAVIWFAKSSYSFGYDIFNQHAMSPGEGQEVTVVIKEGSSVYQIGKILENKGLVEDAKVFWAQEQLSLYKGKLKAGTYILSTAYTPTRIMEILSQTEEEEGGS